ncbi:MAG: DoxX family protein [Alphaproteobacteria bacterium]
MLASSRANGRIKSTIRERVISLLFGRGVVDQLPDTAAWITSVPLLAGRLWLADIFFSAGRVRIESWDSQPFLFSQVHPVPFLSPSLAAPLTAAAEIGLPILLLLGLFGRVGAFGLLVMAMTIQFIVGQTPQGIENGIANPVHYWWMLVGFILTITGPGRLSLDAIIARRFV